MKLGKLFTTCAAVMQVIFWAPHASAMDLASNASTGAQLARAATFPISQPAQPNDCVSQAGDFHGVNSWIVRAILKVESNFNPKAMNKNRNGTTDVGMAQINSMHFKELKSHGIAPDDLLDGCIASYVAAWHLKKQITAYGNTWFAIGAYHSATPCFNKRYTGLVWNVLRTWGVVQGKKESPGSLDSCGSTQVASSGKQRTSSAGTSVLALDGE